MDSLDGFAGQFRNFKKDDFEADWIKVAECRFGSRMTAVLLQVSHGKRPCVEMIPERKPPSCEQMIGIMRQCWDQDRRKRPEFSGAGSQTVINGPAALCVIC
ncbi:Ankyrin repeat and protein kinase domain-containing protein 1 [Liparis tanakae]|uniref:Ankyrin repeat and protein kinase domain-containing protein 1 n=1 Tax=Liparis tanakae TaxID=230148 RepID=A0A4Z2EHZ8_9TELE|nr:Ankyrin repeat and protein kinase domain-containing protein 1 [Liparis tanakae]